MKKSLYITIGLVLCLLIFCAACGKDGTIDNNIDNTPDNTPVTDPDTTPPDTTADDNKTHDTPTPPAQDDPTPPAQDDPTPPAQDDPETPIYPDDSTLAANTDVLKVYYDFISGNTTAYSMEKNEETNFYDGMIKGTTFFEVPDGTKTNVSMFSLVDFGDDGVLELVMKHSGSVYPCGILFYSDEQLWLDYVVVRGMGGLTYNGIAHSAGGTAGSYDIMTFSPDSGCNRQPIVSESIPIGSIDTEYKIHAEYVNNEYVITEPKIVTQDEYDSLRSTIFDQPAAQWHKFDSTILQNILCR